MANILKHILTNIILGIPTRYENMVVFPVLSKELTKSNHLTLDAAMKENMIEFEELSEGSSVNCIRAKNMSNEMVLILDGEELIGAKQNRVINVSILIPGKTTLDIPVSCVEAGRYRYHHPYGRRQFSSKGGYAYHALRAASHKDVHASLRKCGTYETSQARVWKSIDDVGCGLGYRSATGAMSDLYDRTAGAWEKYLAKLSPIQGQTGVLVMINGNVAGMELFGKHDTLRQIFKKLIKGYAFSAMYVARHDQRYTFSTRTAVDFLNTLSLLETETRKSVGLGEDIRFEDNDLTGSALLFNQEPLHLCAFVSSPPSSTETSSGRSRSTRLYSRSRG